ncbi:MAG: radical SAM protein [Candidatus Gracilibacteria bacterium]
MLRYKIFGCKTNKYYTDEWLASDYLKDKSGIFIASCVVTDKAKSKWLKYALRELKNLKQDEKVYLSGCGTMQGGEVDPRFYEIYSELLPYREGLELLPEDPRESKLVGKKFKLQDMSSRISNLRTKLQKSSDRLFARKFIVVQMGCNNFCTFCLTLQARGRHRWRSPEEIIQEVKDFVEIGGEEVVLTGTNIGAWGSEDSNDFQNGELPILITKILEQTKIKKVRISSLGAEFLSDEMIELFGQVRITPYAHLSVQSGSDRILELMRRHYTRDELLKRLAKLKNIIREDGARINIGADLIVGFPDESDQDFVDTLSLVTQYGVTQVHGFPFSAHQSHHSVPAGKFPNQIDEKIKQERLQRLLQAGEKSLDIFKKLHDEQILELLIEGNPTKEKYCGYTQNYLWCDEANFTITQGAIERGKYVRGIYKYRRDDSGKREEELGF